MERKYLDTICHQSHFGNVRALTVWVSSNAKDVFMKRNCIKYFLLFVLVALWLLPAVAIAENVGNSPQLPLLINNAGGIRDAGSSGVLSSFPQANAVQRFREVELTAELLLPGTLYKGDEFILNLFPDKQWTAMIEQISTDINGTLSLSCKIQSLDYGFAIITVSEGRAFANIEIPEEQLVYNITQDAASKRYYLLELDTAKMDIQEGAPSLSVPSPGNIIFPQLAPNAVRSGPLDPADVDIMILYTPAALNYANSTLGINNLLAQVMTKSQLVLNNSLTYITMNLVYSGAVDYTESGNAEVDLVRLATYPGFEPYGESYAGFSLLGYMDEIHNIRDIFGADLVVLLEYISTPGGLGWLMETTAGMPEYAFCINRVQQATTYTPIHEMGHNMGAHHHKAQTVQPGPGLFPYSAGWRWVGTNSARYCDVMTYESGSYYADGLAHSRVAYFSNPSLNYQGVATGDAVDGDNARNMRESKHIVAAYKTANFPEPMNLTITRTEGSGYLDWDDVPYANSYKVFYAAKPNALPEEWNLAGIVGVSQFNEATAEKRFYRVLSSSAALPAR